jgi:hypothetical protein
MEKLAEVGWDYTLYGDGDRLVLVVLCGTVGLFEWAVALTAEERAVWEREGLEGLRPLVRAIQGDPAAFTARKVGL